MRLLAEKVRLHSAKETLIPFRDPLLIGGTIGISYREDGKNNLSIS
jgi:hypothetical protein